MKLTIIAPVYKDSKNLEKFLKKMQSQTVNKFEVVFIVDTSKNDVLKTIDACRSELKFNIKVIFNSSRNGRTSAINQGIREATSDYCLIVSVSDGFEIDFVAKSLDIIKNNKSDVIEFIPEIRIPLKFKGSKRTDYDGVVDVKSHKDIFAYSYPFDFNKFYKTTILLKALELPSLEKENSRFSIEHNYKALVVSKTYSFVEEVLVITKTDYSNTFNPLKLLRQWNSLLKIDIIEDIRPELNYAQYFHVIVFLFGIIGETKNKVLLDKVQNLYDDKFKKTLESFFATNIYILKNNNETKILHLNSVPNKWKKLYRQF